MSTLTTYPFPLDFIKNEIGFHINGTPIRSFGKKSITTYVVNTLPDVGKSVIIEFHDKTIEFKVTAQSRKAALDGYSIQNFTGISLINELRSKIGGNYYINLYYNVSVSEDYKITFTSKEFGGDPVIIRSNDNDNFFVKASQLVGYKRSVLEDYKIYAKYTIDRYKDETSQRVETTEMFYSLDSRNRVFVPVTFLKSYFENIDIPQIGVTNFTTEVLKYAFIKVYFEHAEYFDSKVQMVHHVGPFYLLNGSCLSSYRSANKPDWEDPLSDQVISKCDKVRIFGYNQASVRSFREMPQFVYAYFFDKESSVNTVKNAKLEVSIKRKNGADAHKMFDFSVKNFNFIRINCSLDSFRFQNVDSVIEYSVSIYPDLADLNKKFVKHFRIFKKPIHSSVFLLQNRYGVLESFYSVDQKFEKESFGDKVSKGAVTHYDIENEYKFTALTGYKTKEELQLLSDAEENRFNYIVINNTPVQITIVPESVVVVDTKEDLLNAEFQYEINREVADKNVLVEYFKEIEYIYGTYDSETIFNDQDIADHNNRINNL